MPLQRFDEFTHITFDSFAAGIELAADHIHDIGLRRPFFKKLENPRSNEIQVEHLALLDIEDDRAILSVRAANSIRDSVHRLAPLDAADF